MEKSVLLAEALPVPPSLLLWAGIGLVALVLARFLWRRGADRSLDARHLYVRVQTTERLEEQTRLVADAWNGDARHAGTPAPGPIFEPLVPGLVASLALRIGEAWMQVNTRMAEDWGQDAAALTARAQANLEDLAGHVTLVPEELDGRTTWTFSDVPEVDLPAACLLLSPQARRRAQATIPGTLVVAILTEHLVVMAPDAADAREFLHRMAQGGDELKALTPRLLLWHADGRLEWAPETEGSSDAGA